MITYVGLFGDSAVVSHVFMFFKCFPCFFCVLLTFVCLCGCVFQRHFIDIFSCIAASLFIELTYLLTYLLTDWPASCRYTLPLQSRCHSGVAIQVA